MKLACALQVRSVAQIGLGQLLSVFLKAKLRFSSCSRPARSLSFRKGSLVRGKSTSFGNWFVKGLPRSNRSLQFLSLRGDFRPWTVITLVLFHTQVYTAAGSSWLDPALGRNRGLAFISHIAPVIECWRRGFLLYPTLGQLARDRSRFVGASPGEVYSWTSYLYAFCLFCLSVLPASAFNHLVCLRTWMLPSGF